MTFRLYRLYWLIKEGILARPNSNGVSIYQPCDDHKVLFSPADLDQFFEENRSTIIQSIIDDVTQEGKEFLGNNPMLDMKFEHVFNTRRKLIGLCRDNL